MRNQARVLLVRVLTPFDLSYKIKSMLCHMILGQSILKHIEFLVL